jgi:hypothetical protein
MRLELPRRLPGGPWARAALIAWSLALLIVCTRAVLAPRSHSLWFTYQTAGADWAAGRDLYLHETSAASGLDHFRYSPLVAAFLAPWSRLPEPVGGALWRLLGAAVFLGGWGWWLRAAAPRPVSARLAAVLFLLALPLAVTNLNNGQTNLLVAGLLLAALAAAARDRWTASAALLALASAVKVYPLALGLLLAACHPRRLGPRLALGVLAAFALPFLLQTPSYVLGQYGSWLDVVSADDRRGWALHEGYRDLWLLVRLSGAPLSPAGYMAVQLILAAACAAVCVAGRRLGWTRRPLLALAGGLGACWMVLCGPATESCTYVLLAPVLAWALVEARRRPSPARLALPLAAAALLAAGLLAGLSPQVRALHALGMQPLAALLLFAAVLGQSVGRLARAARAPFGRGDGRACRMALTESGGGGS